MEEVHHRKRVSVLIIVDDESELVEEDLSVDERGILVDSPVHDDLGWAKNENAGGELAREGRRWTKRRERLTRPSPVTGFNTN